MGALGRARRKVDKGSNGKKKESEYVWCLHCEEGFKRSELKPGGDCKNNAHCGGWRADIEGWKEGLGANHPEWPEIPIPGVRYPLNP